MSGAEVAGTNNTGLYEFRIDLQNGFTGKRVLLIIDGKIVYDKRPKTNIVLGFAETVPYKTDSKQCEVEIKVPLTKYKESRTFNLDDGRSIGISVGKGGIVFLQQDRFLYD